MNSTQASIHPAERHSVSLNQSFQGVNCTTLALLTTNSHPRPYFTLRPLCTHQMSQCQEYLPSQEMLSSRVEVVGGRLYSGGLPAVSGAYNWLAQCSQGDTPTCEKGRDSHRPCCRVYIYIFLFLDVRICC